jgi:hypothetical protein
VIIWRAFLFSKFYFWNWYRGGGVESNWVHSALWPRIGLKCQPRVIMMMEKLVEWWLAGETEVLGENLLQCRFVHHKPHMLCPDANPGISHMLNTSFRLELRISHQGLWRVLSSWVRYRIVWYRDKLLTEYMSLYLRGQYSSNYFEFTARIAIIQRPVCILYKPYVIITVFILKQILQTSYCLRTNMYWDLNRLHISINRPVTYT